MRMFRLNPLAAALIAISTAAPAIAQTADEEGLRLEEIVVTDTIPLKKNISKIKVLSVSDLFAKAIRKIHDHESISSLFIKL